MNVLVRWRRKVEAPLKPLMHLVCECSVDWSLCGLDRSGQPFGKDSDETTCVVCADLEDLGCGRCGA